MTWDPTELRRELSTYMGDTKAKASYIQVEGDSWAESPEPIGDAWDTEDAALHHLWYYVELSQPIPLDASPGGIRFRAVYTVYALCAVLPLAGDSPTTQGRTASRDQAMSIARHAYYRLLQAPERIRGTTSHVGVDVGARYGVVTMSQEYHLCVASVPFTFTDDRRVL